MTHFYIEKTFDQSHQIAQGLQRNHELVFDKNEGRFKAIESRRLAQYSQNIRYETNPASVMRLALEYFPQNPDYVDSQRILRTAQGRLRSVRHPLSRLKALILGRRGMDQQENELVQFAERVERYYNSRLRAGNVHEVSKTQALLRRSLEISRMDDHPFRVQCNNILHSFGGRWRLGVHKATGLLCKVPSNTTDSEISFVENEVLEAYRQFITQNGKHEEAIADMQQNLSRQSSPLAQRLLSVTPSPSLSSEPCTPIAGKPNVLSMDEEPDESEHKPIAKHGGMRGIFESYAIDRQIVAVADGLKSNNRLLYNPKVGQQQFVAIPAGASRIPNHLVEPDNHALERFLASCDERQLTKLRQLLEVNRNEQSTALLEKVNDILFERIPGKEIETPYEVQMELIYQGLQPGNRLVYDTHKRLFIAVAKTASFGASNYLITKPEEVEFRLRQYLDQSEGFRKDLRMHKARQLKNFEQIARSKQLRQVLNSCSNGMILCIDRSQPDSGLVAHPHNTVLSTGISSDKQYTTPAVNRLLGKATINELNKMKKELEIISTPAAEDLYDLIEEQLETRLRATTKHITPPFEEQAHVIAQGLEAGYCLLYDQSRDLYICVTQEAFKKIDESDTLIKNEDDVMPRLLTYIRNQEMHDPNLATTLHLALRKTNWGRNRRI
ncbi:MAG: hypothetical protein H7A36_06385 [Chlamydiales bacterium]|nr:hypothetical protein [Chlamydiales bacterium]